MEHVGKCFDDEGLNMNTRNCRITIIAVTVALILLLTLVVTSF